MESREIEKIEELAKTDSVLRQLYSKHKQLDKKLAKLSKKPLLTSEEEREERKLKKLKLVGKDRIIKILESD